MNVFENEYVKLTDAWVKEMSTDALKAFVKAHKARIEMLGRDMVRATDGDVQKAIRGQFAICYEEVDAANAAIEARMAKANAEIVSGIPQEGED